MKNLYLRDDLGDDTKIIWYTTANKGGPSEGGDTDPPEQMTINSISSLVPILTDFYVGDTDKDRVYFDAPLGYPDGMTTTGFVINGKTITGVTKVNDTSGYFTVSSDFTFWEQAYTIRLGEIDDTSHRQPSILYNFSMEHISNGINEFVSTNDKYLTPTGSGNNDGNSEANAYSPEDLKLGGLSPGDTLWMKAGTYDTQVTNVDCFLYIADSGTATNPIWVKGYKTTIGDLDPGGANEIRFVDDFVYTTAAAAQAYFDPTKFPVIEGDGNVDGTRGIRTKQENIIIKNLAITKTKNGIGIALDMPNPPIVNNYYYENIIMGDSSQGNGDGLQVPDTSNHLTAKDIVSFNFDMTCIETKGSYHLIDNCRGYGGALSPSPDYTIGMANCSYSVIKDSKVQSFEGDNIGHGFGVKASFDYEETRGLMCLYNLIVDNDTNMISPHENLYLRRKSVQYNVAKRNTANNVYCLARPGNGSQFNLWEQNKAVNAQVLVGFSGNGESDPWPIPEAGKSIQTNGCIVRNNIATSVNRIFEATVSGNHSEGDNNIFLNTNMLIHNNTVDGVSEEFIYTRLDDVDNGQTGWSYDFSGTEFKNNIFVLDTTNPENFFYNSLVDQSDFIWDSNNWTEKPASWTLPTNETNQSTVDPNFVNEVGYEPQEETMTAPKISTVPYSYNENERKSTTTIGAVLLLKE